MANTAPLHDTPILGMLTRPHVPVATEYGNAASFWVEYPNGLVDLTRTAHLPQSSLEYGDQNAKDVPIPPLQPTTQFDVPVDGDRVVRIAKGKSAIVINRHAEHNDPGLQLLPTPGLKRPPVRPRMRYTSHERRSRLAVPEHQDPLGQLGPDRARAHHDPALARARVHEERPGRVRLTAPGRLRPPPHARPVQLALVRPLQALYEEGRRAGTDVWIHKNRMSGLWGPQSALDLYLQEMGITTLFFAGVNADQCVLGTLVDSYFRAMIV
ncbi:hypothetical protein A0H81_01071 [Grifola frondosa]|uniref:Isochorismatase-like domain-containing protein n=1 Tax=Grifola frondosa TaxID=5627 RepID=A0A1C7MRI3_GRIFR|nr:hypothetical protein A0H81_01071 [Grifola frondosa]